MKLIKDLSKTQWLILGTVLISDILIIQNIMLFNSFGYPIISIVQDLGKMLFSTGFYIGCILLWNWKIRPKIKNEILKKCIYGLSAICNIYFVFAIFVGILGLVLGGLK